MSKRWTAEYKDKKLKQLATELICITQEMLMYPNNKEQQIAAHLWAGLIEFCLIVDTKSIDDILEEAGSQIGALQDKRRKAWGLKFLAQAKQHLGMDFRNEVTTAVGLMDSVAEETERSRNSFRVLLAETGLTARA